MTRNLFLALSLIVAVGCIGCTGTRRAPANPSQLSTAPAAVSDGVRTQFMLSLQNLTNKPNSAILIAWSRSPIGGGASLLFKIDGTPLELESMDRVSTVDRDTPGQQWFTKRYEVGLPLLRQLAAATNALARLNLERSFVQGQISNDTPKTFRPALRQFLAEVGTASPKQ